MEEKKFHREEYPLEILAKFGLTEEMIYDLPNSVHETIERGGKTPLLPIRIEQPFGVTRCYAKFSLIDTEDGIDVMFSPKLKQARLETFTEEQKQLLLSGKVIVAEVDDTLVTDEGVEEIQRIKAFVQLDQDTNGVIYVPSQAIGRNLNAASMEYDLAGDELHSFWDGHLVTVIEKTANGKEEPVTIGVDLFTDKGVLVVPGTAEQWEGLVRRPMPKYSFGNDGCWVNQEGRLSYVPDKNFTKEILYELDRLAKRNGMEKTELSESLSKSPCQAIDNQLEEGQRQLVR